MKGAAQAALNRANELYNAGKLMAAEQALNQLPAGSRSSAPAQHLMGLVLMGTGRELEAVLCLEQVVRHSPPHAVRLGHLGEALRRTGQLRSAIEQLEQALALSPGLVDARISCAAARLELGEGSAAIELLDDGVQKLPQSFALQFRLADALRVTGMKQRAALHYLKALALDQQSLPAWVDLAEVLCGLRRFADAVLAARRAVELAPASAEAHERYGIALLEAEQLGTAIVHLRRACELDSSRFLAQYNYAHAAFRAGLPALALTTYRAAMAIVAGPDIHSNLIFASSFVPGLSAADLLAEAQVFAQLYADPVAPPLSTHANDPSPERRLRIGYVSPDFCNHCQSLFMAPLLAAHSRAEFEIVCYASVRTPDAVTEMLRSRSDVWHDVSALDDAALAARIRDDAIDILVDLTMHMDSGRLTAFARRPAPVQVTWLAYPGTTGLKQIDYRVTDRYLEGDGDLPDAGTSGANGPVIQRLGNYAEESIVLPDTFWCYDPQTVEPAVSTLPARENGFVTFGCLSNYSKVNDDVLRLWARVLVAVPGARLRLRAPAGEPRERAAAVLGAAGVHADRLLWVEHQPWLAYLREYQRIDLCLDTFPYNGHTVSLDAFWMGVPVVTLVGETIVGRAGLCMASNLGLPELVAHNEQDFIVAAVGLASDLDRLEGLRAGLRERMQRSALMDSARFAKHLELAYREVWRRWCRRSPSGDSF